MCCQTTETAQEQTKECDIEFKVLTGEPNLIKDPWKVREKFRSIVIQVWFLPGETWTHDHLGGVPLLSRAVLLAIDYLSPVSCKVGPLLDWTCYTIMD